MANEKGLLSRLRLYISMVRYGNAHNQDFAHEHYAFFTAMQQRLPQYGMDDVRGKRVLDVGCGKAYWLTLLLHSYGAAATGVDTEFVEPGFSLGKYWGILRSNGPERTLRTLVWDMFYGPPYYRELARVCDFPLNFKGVDARRSSATELDFPDHTFNLVVSHEVFEHIDDIPTALKMVHRVMKSDGLTYIYIHNYASLSGGHHIAWKYPDTEPSTEVPPWDHLRENRFPEIPSWINRLREHEYRPAFESLFDILDWFPTSIEGKALLTPEIRTELADYSEDELLTKGFVVVARPKK
jgi:SAM-dependent methyltransferase